MAKPKLNLASFTGVVAAAAGTTIAPDAEIELALIDVERQVRTELGDLTNLAAGIADIGVLEPILLLAKDDSRYRLIAGERRYRASLLAGKTKIPALIKRGLTEFQIRQIQVTENNDREDLSAFDEAMGVAEDAEKYGFKEAQKIWNRSEGWVSKRVAVKKYAEPVCALLKNKLCGDLEVLHSLNQLFDASVEDFGHMQRRLKEGLPLSRDEARNKVATVKAFKKEQAGFAKRRAEVQAAAAAAKQDKAPKLPQDPRKNNPVQNPDGDGQGAALVAHADKAGQVHLPSREPSAEEVAEVAEAECEHLVDLARGLKSQREEVFAGGATIMGHFNSMKTNLAELDCDMNEAEWVLWSGFLSMVLPMMHALGDDRALSYVKRLQTEFKTKTPILMWRELHPLAAGADPEDEVAPRNETPAMPANWRF